MALRKVRSNLDRLFDKSLTDLIRGIRNNKDNEARYIASCIEEIKMELRQDHIYVKANAIEKLAYLQMLGYDISWASFNIIEVMVSTKYTEKRIGYLAAAQSFTDVTEVLMLTTNLIRKDLNSSNIYDAGVALGGLSCFVTPDLARDLASDIVNLLSSSRPYIRKRAILMLYKVFLKYPEALRPTFPRLKEKLEDSDPGVQSAAVNVICELARKNPKNYLTLAPIFFKLMTTSSNNWMLIKIIKLFGALVPLEPRLGKKLLEPLTNLINSTSAMSLLYECINTVIAVLISISSGGDHTASIQLCVQKLGVLIEDSDQNLKYLGLLAMGKILQTHPKAVQAHKDIVLRCLDDKDESIRLRALDLLYGMVSKKNIMEIVKKLMEHVDSAEGSHYRDELLSRIVGICSYNNYQYITNFEWYISVLVELTKVEGTKHGAKIAEQIQDVTVRVESIRHFSVSQMALLVENAHVLLAGSVQQRSNICEVLLAAAWICGEYNQHVRNVHSVLESMLKAKPSVMPGHILSVYLQNIGKLYSALLSKAEEEGDWDTIESLDNLMLSKLPQFELSEHLEAQERACNLMGLLRILESAHQRKEKIASEAAALFEGELNPVAAKAQKKVPVPEGLDLDAWIGEEWQNTPVESSDESDLDDRFGKPALRGHMEYSYAEGAEEATVTGTKQKKTKKGEPVKLTEEEKEALRRKREAEIQNNPYYVKGSATTPPKRPTKFVTPMNAAEASDKLDIQSPLEIPGVVGLHRYMEQQDSTLSWKNAVKEKKGKKKTKGKKGKKNVSVSSEEEAEVVHKVNRDDGEMPEGARSTDDEKDEKTVNNEFKALDINLDEPLRPDEVVKGPQAYTRITAHSQGPLIPRPPTTYDPPYSATNMLAGVEKPKKVVKKKAVKDGTGEKKKKKSKKSEGGQERNGASAGRGALIDMDSWLDEKGEELQKNLIGKATQQIKAEKTKKKKSSKVSENIRERAEYMEAAGVSTPSNPNAGGSPMVRENGSASNESSVARLCTNSDLVVDFETTISQIGEVGVTLRLTNVGGKSMKKVEVNIIDTMNVQVQRMDANEEVIRLTDQLPSGTCSESSIPLTVHSISVSQSLKGSITYFVEDVDGTSDGKVDFKLPLPSLAFLGPCNISKEAYSQLLGGDEVDSNSSAQCSSDLPLKRILEKLVKQAHFIVIEETKNAASLFATSIRGNSVCLLVKKSNDSVQIDGKAGDPQLIYSIVSDVKELISRKG
ncbi:hypothetical protein WR25_27155 [Diploscapter pachys]|uniref:AP-3 complex subunit delta n=1 Tax=Diploscapter pachys TaxID=2018661 RepID=A0A2A2LX04_9BILA|nr:hypothetical protein WR25_27155 [Diploscapter pachys]